MTKLYKQNMHEPKSNLQLSYAERKQENYMHFVAHQKHPVTSKTKSPSPVRILYQKQYETAFDKNSITLASYVSCPT